MAWRCGFLPLISAAPNIRFGRFPVGSAHSCPIKGAIELFEVRPVEALPALRGPLIDPERETRVFVPEPGRRIDRVVATLIRRSTFVSY
jgi:hypothetical protein